MTIQTKNRLNVNQDHK